MSRRLMNATPPGLVLSVCALNALPLAGQEVIELPAEDRLIEANFEELYRVGSLQGDWDTFGRVAGVAFDPAGNLYVLDTQATRISVVDLGGNLVRQVGREGDGPGEFAGSSAPMLRFTVLGDGRIAVYDPGRRAFAMFRGDGEFERSIAMGGTTIPLIPGLGADPAAASVVSTGEVRHVLMSRPAPGEGAAEPSYRYVKRYILGGDKVVVDTVATAWKPPGDPEGFAPLLRAGVLPDGGVAFTDSSAYAIKITAPGGALNRILTRPFGAVPVTGGVKAAYIERELEDLRRSAERGDAGSKAMADFRRAQLESMAFYHEIPVIRGLRTSREGTIWVRRRGDEPGSNGPIDLITADGRYLGSFARDATGLPSAFGPDGLVAFVQSNDLGVQTVVVKRLPPQVR